MRKFLFFLLISIVSVEARAGCPTPVEHRPAPDVAYTPGVDAHGWAVAPADLHPEPIGPQDTPPVQLNIPLDEKYGMRQPTGRLPETDSFVPVGTVTVHEGEAYLNGKPLSPEIDTGCEDVR